MYRKRRHRRRKQRLKRTLVLGVTLLAGLTLSIVSTKLVKSVLNPPEITIIHEDTPEYVNPMGRNRNYATQQINASQNDSEALARVSIPQEETEEEFYYYEEIIVDDSNGSVDVAVTEPERQVVYEEYEELFVEQTYEEEAEEEQLWESYLSVDLPEAVTKTVTSSSRKVEVEKEETESAKQVTASTHIATAPQEEQTVQVAAVRTEEAASEAPQVAVVQEQPAGDYRVVMITATAYCPCVKCCGKTDGITASGVKATQWHTIAAGGSIPFGTQIYFPALADMPNGGWFVVEDRGGSISDAKIDVYFDVHQDAINFGRKTLEAHIYN